MQGGFFQAGDLGLRDADFISNLHLGFSMEKAQGEDEFFPFS